MELDSRPMEALKLRLNELAAVIPPGSQVVYLDYPLHENFGDILIMKGTLRFFAEHGIRVRRRYSCVNYNGPYKLPEDWIVVCHGGGNFGDLYPYYQRLREAAVRHYPNNRIVVLPQTIHFRDETWERRSFALFGAHRDLHLFVRDEASYEKARGRVRHLHLLPDMAHYLYPVRSGGPDGAGSGRVLGLLRKDGEVHPETDEAAIRADVETDWPKLMSGWERLALKGLVLGSSLDRRLGNRLPVWTLWRLLAERLMAKAIRLYAGSGSVVTNRLHGHILACLMDKPNAVHDNSYGKNGEYYRKWTFRLGHARAIPPRASSERIGMSAEQ